MAGHDDNAKPLSVGDAFAHGTGMVWRHKRVILWLYLLNLLFAGVLVYPFRQLAERISRTDLAEEFVSGFSFGAFVDLWVKESDHFRALGWAALGLGCVYLLVNVMVSGGIVGMLAGEGTVSLRHFLHQGGKHFWRFLRLFLLAAILLAAVGAAYKFWLSDQIERFQEEALTDRAAFFWRAGGVAITAVVATLILMIFDYARIRTVVERRRSMIAATFRGAGFAVRKCLRAVPLFYLNVLIVAVLVAVYLAVARTFSSASYASVIGLFLVQQAFLISRIWMRFSFYATQLAYFGSVRAGQRETGR